ncbi:MAG: T9SS type A sorting domain-containing protein, partial [Bacteroidetes bacterium]|nr:T9SS type A sorting domain-containing protein [Bacteroidota bacterium]
GNGEYLWAYLYDNNGTTLLTSGNTSTTTDINADGLAAGTYYIRINSYYDYKNNNYTNNHFEPYTIADSLFTPAMANDIEPNDTKATALTLPRNGSKTGHVNYYYNNIRDSQDWYKVTTNADGRLRLRLSSGNGEYLWAYLYDNNGTTLLTSGNTSTTTDINADGLAAGTYYIRINSYYDYKNNNYTNNHFEPYTIADSLFTPGQANDAEPNNTSNQAIVMAPNSTMTGHVNYYYNNVKDTFDWYEITIPDDGNINIAITSHNGQNIYAYFYDHDGSTQLNSKTTTGTDNFNIDGLQKGTYYLKLKTYYSSEFIPYTVTNTFTTYTNATDTVPNDAPYQALTMKANQATTGHVNFYYNGNRDVADWLKINYTGSGSLTLNLTQEAHITGGNNNLSVYVYKDTLQSYIASQTSTSSSWQMNLNSLTQGYYYIKVKTYYNSEFVSYTIEDVFTQVNVAKISVTSYDTASSCSSTNKIAFKPRKSQAPYTVQLYRFGVAYGAPLTITNNHNFFFNNLPTGSYYATVYGDGASGTAFGKSTTINLEPIPQNLTTTNITNTQAKLNWNGVACAGYYTIQYRVQGDPNWLKKKTKNTTPSFILKGLTANTTYEWQVATSDSANGIIATGVYSSIATFTTNAVFSGANNGNEEGLQMKAIMNDDINGISVFPNPASTQVKIQMSAKITGTVDLLMKAMNGKVVWTAIHKDAASINGSTINVGNLPSGIYMLQIILQDGKVYTTKVVVTR